MKIRTNFVRNYIFLKFAALIQTHFMSKLVIVGTVAFDAIETPFGKTDKILGGAGTFIGLAASQFDIDHCRGVCCGWRLPR
jgi:hypothetical protein